ncbi:MAG: HAD family phosphatase [bacterium]
MTIQAILFDMNGVIVNDEPLQEEAFRKVLATQFQIKLAHEDYLLHFAGKTDLAGFQSILTTYHELDFAELLTKKFQIYQHLTRQSIPIYPEVVAVINKLREKFPVALVTAASKKEVIPVLKSAKLENAFKVILTAEDFTHHKPDPEPYRKACELLNVNPENAIVIEDSPSGVQSAKAAGCYCIGILNTHSRENLQSADLVVKSYKEIEEIVRGTLTR